MEYDSGYFIKEDVEDCEGSEFISGLQGIPVLKYFLSAISRTKGFSLNGYILHVTGWAEGSRD